jgi:hypothetical protein
MPGLRCYAEIAHPVPLTQPDITEVKFMKESPTVLADQV